MRHYTPIFWHVVVQLDLGVPAIVALLLLRHGNVISHPYLPASEKRGQHIFQCSAMTRVSMNLLLNGLGDPFLLDDCLCDGC